MDKQMSESRSLADTPTWSVATVTTVMVAICFVVERSIYRFGKWLKKTKRKALLASLEKIKEELMLLGFISLMLGQWARWISEICVDSSLFVSRFYPCSRGETVEISSSITDASANVYYGHCSEGHEPFVSYESLEQLHRFLFVLGITHVFYSCYTILLTMIKIYSWRKWELLANPMANENLQVILINWGYFRTSPCTIILVLKYTRARRNAMTKRQSTFVFHHASHPWSNNRFLIWMLCFVRQFKGSIKKSDYMALRLGFITNHKLPLSYNFHKYMVRSMEDEFQGIVGISWPLWGYAILCIFINVHGLNIYFWISFIPPLLILLVGTKLQHVVAQLALEIVEATGPLVGTQLKPRDDLFWFGKPELLLWLIQFISFQNAFEMATFIWSLWGFKEESCFMKNHLLVAIRLASGLLVQFWCSYSTLPLNVIITQMGSRFKKALISQYVRESLNSWCKRVKEKSKHSLGTTRSTCSLATTIDERDDEIITVVSGTLSRCSSTATQRSIQLKHVYTVSMEEEAGNEISDQLQCDLPSEHSDCSSPSSENNLQLMLHQSVDDDDEETS